MKAPRTKRARPTPVSQLEAESSTPPRIPTGQRQAAAENGSSDISNDAIARRAHELFVSRGAVHGHDLDDWLEAERQIRSAEHSL